MRGTLARTTQDPRRLGSLEVDVARYRATLDGEVIDLSRAELELLACLIDDRARVVSRQELSEALGFAAGRSVDVVLSGLRQKLPVDFIRNVRNRGWIIQPTEVGA